MSDLINRNDIYKLFENGIAKLHVSDIDVIPTVDAVEVVHGRWAKSYKSGVTVTNGYVSNCCEMWNERKTNYCPHCGAKMDEVSE